MMIEVLKEQMPLIAPLFAESEETMVLSCLQGIMGRAWADVLPAPRCARIDVGDFSFFAGDSNAVGDSSVCGAEELTEGSKALAVPLSAGWERPIQAVYPEAKSFERYAIRKDTAFDREKLAAFADGLPSGYTLVPIDQTLYQSCLALDWARDFCSLFPTWEDFERDGLGWLALYEGEPVAGASSYSVYRGGIEIQIETRKDHRRKGLALCCGAKLILTCLGKGLYPSWDAANPASVALAEKLGYKLKGSYTTWEISPVERV